MTSSQPDGAIQPNYTASADFLKLWAPIGPWVLVALDPDKKGIEVDTFSPLDEKRMMKWLGDQGTKLKRNCYFTVNPCIRPMMKKPERVDIGALSWIHVDLDPRSGEPLDEERSRILKLLQDPTAKGIPKPTCIVFSGGGYQGFWRLREPLLLDGKLETAIEADRWNKQLELVLGGDACHNVDRIMRLPGTINRPNERKRKKGRKEIRAELIEFNDAQHDLAKFIKAPMVVQGSDAPGFAGNTVKISGNIKRLSSVDELPKEVSAEAKVVIVQGTDPDNPEKFGTSRSEWLFFACCELVRAGCDDNLIYSVITDPDFGISSSVLDKGSSTERYAIRQIERAREDAVDPILREFNDKHALIRSIGSKGLCRIIGEEWDPALERSRIAYQDKTNFLLGYTKKTIDWVDADGKAASKPAAQWWLQHPLGRQYDTVVFAPGKETPGAYNLWKGFAFEAIQGEIPLFEAHVKNVIADGDPEVAEWLWKFMAWTIQNPGRPAEVAVVLIGDPGTGKGVFVGHFGKLFGRHFLSVTGSDLVAGRFSGHLREIVVAFFDEQRTTGNEEMEAKAKVLISERMLTTEAKGVDAEATPNCLHIFIASNSTWVVPVDDKDRRYAVLNISDTHKQEGPYFAAIEAEMLSGGYEALLYRLLNWPLGNWHPRQDRPVTDALSEQKTLSRKGLDRAFHDCLQSGELPIGEVDADSWVWVPTTPLVYWLNEKWRPSSPFTSDALKILLGKPRSNQKKGKGLHFEKERREYGAMKQAPGYWIPPLPEARKAWDEYRSPDPTWDPDDKCWAVVGDRYKQDGNAHWMFG